VPLGKISTWPKNLTGKTISCLGISQGLNFWKKMENMKTNHRDHDNSTYIVIMLGEFVVYIEPIFSNFFLAFLGNALFEQSISITQAITPSGQI
jgi:hypothetical protein